MKVSGLLFKSTLLITLWAAWFGCGYFYHANTQRAWLANTAHVNITLLECNARATFYDSLNTVPVLIDAKSYKQIDSMSAVMERLKRMFPRDTVIPCRIVRGDKYSREWVDSVLHVMDSVLRAKDSISHAVPGEGK